MKTNTYLIHFFAGLLLLLPSIAFSQEYATTDTVELEEELLPTIFNEFYTGTDEIVELTIETNMRQWIRKKYREEYQKAKLSYTNKKGEEVVYNIKIRPRGNIRKEICFFPPLKFKFKKLDLEEQSLLTDFNDFKMVNQCKNSRDNGGYIFKEYMAYKLYSFISPHSLRAQLITLNYIDSEGKSKPQQLNGFIIEPVEEMAERVKGVEIKRKKFGSNGLERAAYVRMAAFQYMIGNTDWSLANMHNMKLLKVAAYPKVLPIPYDFDYSGLVDAHYAVPFETLPIKDVSQRYYFGNSCTEEEIKAIESHYMDCKDSVMAYCEQFPHLSSKDQKKMLNFMEDFFEIIEHPKKKFSVFK